MSNQNDHRQLNNLPPNWELVREGDSVYYYNIVSQKSQWEFPFAESSVQPKESAAPPDTVASHTANAAFANYSTVGHSDGFNDKNESYDSSEEVPPSLAKGQDIHSKLVEAVSTAYSGPDEVRLLLQQRADPLKRHTDGNMPIHIAATAGYADCVEILALAGGQWTVGAAGANKDSPAHCACRAGEWSTPTLQVLFDLATTAGNVRVFSLRNAHNQTPLHVAAELGNLEAVQWLLR